jgi:cytochrome P450
MAVYFLISTGSIFMFSVGSKQILHMTDPEVVKEISICTSLDFGKPSYQSKERGPLLGQGILTSNGATWAHHRKILAPELYMQKVKVYMLQIKRKYERKSYHIYIYKSRVPT